MCWDTIWKWDNEKKNKNRTKNVDQEKKRKSENNHKAVDEPYNCSLVQKRLKDMEVVGRNDLQSQYIPYSSHAYKKQKPAPIHFASLEISLLAMRSEVMTVMRETEKVWMPTSQKP